MSFITTVVVAAGLTYGVVTEIVQPVGSYVMDQATWATHQVAARVDNWMN